MARSPFSARRWWHVLPVVFVAYSLAFLDRVNFSFAAAAGMSRDLHITADMASLISSLFFLGYFFFQIPGAAYAQRHSVKKLIFVSLIVWGVVAPLTGVVSNPHALLLIRFVLGMTEAAVLPALLIYLSHWFTRSERSRANTLLVLGNPVTVIWMSILSGYLVQSVGWRWMFIVEGAPALLWAVVWWFTIKEHPAEVSWLSAAEKLALSEALASEQVGMKAFKNYRAAFKSPTVIILCAQYFCWSVAIYGIILWLPSILSQTSKVGIAHTGWLAAGPFLLAIAAELAVSYFSDRTLERKTFIWAGLLVGALAFYGSQMVAAGNFWLSYSLLTVAIAAIYAPYGPFFALHSELLPANVLGGGIALINSFGALGSFVGSFVVGHLNGATGNANQSYLFMAGSLAVSVVMTLLVRVRSKAK